VKSTKPFERAFSLALFLILAVSTPLQAEAPADDTSDRRSAGSVPYDLRSSVRIGSADSDLPMDRMVLVLRSRDPQGLEALLHRQQDPASPDYHRWLTPEEFGRRFGALDADVDAVVAWLGSQGFDIQGPTAGRTALLFSGRLSQVERAFQTRIAEVAQYGRPHFSNELVPSLPARLSRSVVGLLSLNDFQKRKPFAHRIEAPDPLFTNGSSHYLAPSDLSLIYNVDPLIAAGINGGGLKIGIPSRSNVNPENARTFRVFFGLAANDPTTILNGSDPGILSGNDESFAQEATLDIEWAGATAPNASILLIVSKSTTTTDGIDLSTIFTVNDNKSDTISISYGSCEQNLTAEDLALYNNLYAQATAQGTSVFVASGDSGAADCELGGTQGQTLSVNGLSSSPYATAVGGSQFDEGGNVSAYWETSNLSDTKRSAKVYIPEVPWNESGTVAGGRGLSATGGGASIIYEKPSWQVAPGVPGDGRRDTPDVALNGAAHTAYLVQYGRTSSQLSAFYGTSASTPAFAGIATLIAQKVGGRLGNINPMLYALGSAQYSGGAAVFHDITTGNNSVPGVSGYSAGPGYDQVSGLGSVDALALANSWAALAIPSSGADFSLGATPGIADLGPGKSIIVTVSLTSLADSPETVQLTASALPVGVTASFSPSLSTSSAVGYVSSGTKAVLTLTAAASAPNGTFPVTLSGTSGNTARSITIFVSIPSPAAPLSPGLELQVPVVLDVFGAGGSHFTSDLVAVNRGASATTVLLRYVAAPGTSGESGPVIARSIGAGRQLYVPDAIAFLRANGYSLSTDTAAKIGTLFVTFVSVSDPTLVFAGSRTSTPNKNTSVGGAFGTFSSAVASAVGSPPDVFVYGLKENSSFRSNLGLVHSPNALTSLAFTGPVSLEVQIFNGDTGRPAGAPIPVTLQIGEFRQLDTVLTLAGSSVSNGYVRVRRTSGVDRFIAYGVVNDGPASGGGTSDGSIIVAGGSEGLIPIVLDLPGATHYRTELSLTNPGSSAATVTLTYTPSDVFGGSGGGTVTTTLGPGLQSLNTDSIAFLRRLGLQIPADGSKQGGTLLVTGAVAQGRTYNPNPDSSVGGTYGVAYPALGASQRAQTGAYVYGLRQDSSVRSNLALADARVGDASTVEYSIEIYDADSGSTTPAMTFRRSLTGGQWTQIDGVLGTAGIANGYARVRPASGSSDFVVYGVVNDGPSPGSRTSDGSYLPMVVSVPVF
jgi:pseudomonalisin